MNSTKSESIKLPTFANKKLKKNKDYIIQWGNTSHRLFDYQSQKVNNSRTIQYDGPFIPSSNYAAAFRDSEVLKDKFVNRNIPTKESKLPNERITATQLSQSRIEILPGTAGTLSNQKDISFSPTKKKYQILHKTAKQCLKN